MLYLRLLVAALLGKRFSVDEETWTVELRSGSLTQTAPPSIGGVALGVVVGSGVVVAVGV